MENIITACILGAAAIICFIIGVLQLLEKGVLINNAYIHASKTERERMDKRPHYRQSGVVFMLIGGIFSVNTVACIVHRQWLFFLVGGLAFSAIVYAIISSVIIEKKKPK